MEEMWKYIKGYEGRYMVSSKGRVKRLPNGRGYNSKEIIKSNNRLNQDGYVMITLPNGERPLHRLVAEAWVENPENKPTVNHIDGNKLNNDFENLEWATRSEQLYHAYKLGLKKPVHTNRKLTDKDIEFIRSHYIKNHGVFGVSGLARQFNVSTTTIKNVISGKYYKNIINRMFNDYSERKYT